MCKIVKKFLIFYNIKNQLNSSKIGLSLPVAATIKESASSKQIVGPLKSHS